MTTVLPSEVLYGTVVGKFLKAVGDSADADVLPDSVPIEGTVTFTPLPEALLAATASIPFTVLPQPITVALDLLGRMVVALVATDDANLNPLDWTYAVSFQFVGVKYNSFSIRVPHGTIIDLSVVAPVPGSGGTAVVPPPITPGTYLPVRSTPPSPLTWLAYIDTSTIPPTLKVWNSNTLLWEIAGGGSPSSPSAVAFTDNGNSTYTAAGTGVTDNGDGTNVLVSTGITDNGNGTWTGTG